MTKEEVVKLLETPIYNEELMKVWDNIRAILLNYDYAGGSLPRDIFESLIDSIDQEREEIASWIKNNV